MPNINQARKLDSVWPAICSWGQGEATGCQGNEDIFIYIINKASGKLPHWALSEISAKLMARSQISSCQMGQEKNGKIE